MVKSDVCYSLNLKEGSPHVWLIINDFHVDLTCDQFNGRLEDINEVIPKIIFDKKPRQSVRHAYDGYTTTSLTTTSLDYETHKFDFFNHIYRHFKIHINSNSIIDIKNLF